MNQFVKKILAYIFSLSATFGLMLGSTGTSQHIQLNPVIKRNKSEHDSFLFLHHATDLISEKIELSAHRSHSSHSSHSSHRSHSSHYSSTHTSHYSSISSETSPNPTPTSKPSIVTPESTSNEPLQTYGQHVEIREDGSSLISLKTNKNNYSLKYNIINPPSHGKITSSINGLYYYKPDKDYTGEDYFTYNVSDGITYSNVSVVLIDVKPVNDVPELKSEVIMVKKGIPSEFKLEIYDPDSKVTVEIMEKAKNGIIKLVDDKFTYIPSVNYVGADSFKVSISDEDSRRLYKIYLFVQ
jgi:hypothetical protein